MTFDVNNFADLRNAVSEMDKADFDEDFLTLIFRDADGIIHRIVLDDDSVTYEEADERGMKKDDV